MLNLEKFGKKLESLNSDKFGVIPQGQQGIQGGKNLSVYISDVGNGSDWIDDDNGDNDSIDLTVSH